MRVLPLLKMRFTGLSRALSSWFESTFMAHPFSVTLNHGGRLHGYMHGAQ